MAQLVVRGIESEVKTRLQRRARRNGRSMEEEVRTILRFAAGDERDNANGFGSEVSKLFAPVGLSSAVSELRGHAIKAAKFDR